MKSDNVKCGMQQAPHRSLFNHRRRNEKADGWYRKLL